MTDRPRDLIAHLVGVRTDNSSVPIELLKSVRDSVTTPTDLADERSITRKTVYRALEPLADRRIVIHREGTFESTGYCAVLCHLFETRVDESAITYENIRFLSSSEYRVALLQNLQTKSKTKAELATGERSPSRATVHRAIGKFEELDWVVSAGSGEYTLTGQGEEITDSYVSLLEAVRCAEKRAAFLYCCGDAVADIPLAALADAQMYEHTPVAPDRLRTVYQELLDEDLATFRGLLSQVSLSDADIGDSIIQAGTDTELVVTKPVLYNLPTEGRYTEHVKRGLKAKNHTLLIASDYDIFPAAIAICDDTVLIGPATADRVPSGVPAGVIVGSDEVLVEWATQLYDQYRSQSAPLSRHILNSLINAISENVSSGVSSLSSDN